MDIDVEKRVKKEVTRLKKYYKEIEKGKKEIVTGLVERAAFMRVQCEDLEEDLLQNGWTEPFAQGNQEPYDRARPQGQTYHTLNSNYQKIIKQLTDLLPKGEIKVEKSDGFEEFVGGRD